MQEEKTFFSYFKSFLSLFVKILFLKVNRFLAIFNLRQMYVK